jgi:hypothetical protein
MYSTLGCHLCEEAQRVVVAALGHTVAERDIVDDPQWLARYEVRIPVLARLDSGAELDWPFDAKGVRALLAGDRES